MPRRPSSTSPSPTPARARRRPRAKPLVERLEAAGQGHLLAHLESLAPPARKALLEEIEVLDLGEIRDALSRLREGPAQPSALEAPEVFPLRRASEQEALARAARKAGEALLRAGKVACLTVAGGQATRLQWEGPKGCLAVGPVSGRTLFEIHAGKLAGARRRYGGSLPWYVMTSPANHEATVRAFEEKAWFGLPKEDVRIFPQGTVPAVDLEGRLLLAASGGLVRSPDGHGGLFGALRSQSILEDARRRGVEHFSYFQVDNPLIPVADALFLGLHARRRADLSAKFVAKRDPGEKVGLLVRTGGRVGCVEYSDLPAALAAERDGEGRLRLRFGNIACHAISLPFAASISPDDLPFHRAEKAIRALGPDGREVLVHGVKFERFIFDALPRAREVVLLEVEREEEFSPVKNASGENSPATAAASLAAQAARWFVKAGLSLPPPGPGGFPLVEVSGRFALDEAEFLERAAGLEIDPRGPVFLDEEAPWNGSKSRS